MPFDLDLVAQCWLCSWPFRAGRTTSSDRRVTQHAINALLGEGYAGLLRALGPRRTEQVILRAAYQNPPLSPRTAERRSLLVDERIEWNQIILPGKNGRDLGYYLATYYSDEERWVGPRPVNEEDERPSGGGAG